MNQSVISDKLRFNLQRIRAKVKSWRKTQQTAAFNDMRQMSAEAFLRGEGIEVGALHRPLWVPKGVKIRYVDRLSVKGLRKHYPELKGLPLVDVDIIDNGETLTLVKPNSIDFIVANHFLEHCQNPIKTLLVFFSKLRSQGILYMAIPDKDFTFDIKRPVTTYQHIVDDYKNSQRSRKSHYEEWTKLVEGISDRKKAVEHTSKLMRENYSIHFHVWDQPALLSLFFKLRARGDFKFDIMLMLRNNEEIILVLKKH